MPTRRSGRIGTYAIMGQVRNHGSMDMSRREFLVSSAVAVSALRTSRLAAASADGVPPADRELHVKVQGGSIYVRINGTPAGPRKPIVFVHGGPGGSLAVNLMALPLASERAVILYDQLDSGRSEAPGNPANWTVNRFADEIDAIRNAVGFHEFHLFGGSWGGTIANVYASRRPAALRSLVLASPFVSAKSWEEGCRSWYASLPKGVGALLDQHERAGTVEAADYLDALAIFQKAHLRRFAVPPEVVAYRATLPKNSGNAIAKALVGGLEIHTDGLLKDFDNEALLERINVPTLFMTGEFDYLAPVVARKLSLKLRSGEFVVIPGSAHDIANDKPVLWREAIAHFVERHDGPE